MLIFLNCIKKRESTKTEKQPSTIRILEGQSLLHFSHIMIV
jgi:hypothetical protein